MQSPPSPLPTPSSTLAQRTVARPAARPPRGRARCRSRWSAAEGDDARHGQRMARLTDASDRWSVTRSASSAPACSRPTTPKTSCRRSCWRPGDSTCRASARARLLRDLPVAPPGVARARRRPAARPARARGPGRPTPRCTATPTPRRCSPPPRSRQPGHAGAAARARARGPLRGRALRRAALRPRGRAHRRRRGEASGATPRTPAARDSVRHKQLSHLLKALAA